MAPIRVLIVDDSIVIRRLLSDCLGGDPEIEVAGTAASGRIALAKLAQLNPDAITLDVEMPDMDGIQTLIEIRKLRPRLPVIMFSSLTERGAMSTIAALAHGASDYVTKPSNLGSFASALQCVRDELVPKVKALCPRQSPEPLPAVQPTPSGGAGATIARLVPAGASRFQVVAIGVSTGGPNALATLIPELPASLPVPVVVVQHMPPMFTKLLADHLSAASKLTVREAHGAEMLAPGQVWIAPGDRHLVVARAASGVRLEVNQAAHENSCRPSVDVLFRSIAEVYGAQALAVVLTGMGRDGLIGATRIKERQGTVLVQDEASSVVWGMPRYVARAGLADRVLPLDTIARTIVGLTGARREPAGPRAAVGAER